MVLSCLRGASLAKAILCSKRHFKGQSVLRIANRGAHPKDLPRTGPIAIEIVLKVIQNPAPFQNRDSIGNLVRRVFLVPPSCFLGGANSSFLPRWCLAGCLIDPFLPSWYLPGASRLSKWLVPASLVPRWLSDGSFPASLVLRRRL